MRPPRRPPPPHLLPLPLYSSSTCSPLHHPSSTATPPPQPPTPQPPQPRRKCGGERRLTRDEQRRFKYALLLDSFGPGFDAALWKLLGGAAAFQVNPDADGGKPLWALFYSPFLIDKRHYFAAPVSRLADAVAWCRANDAACAAVAAAGRARADCALRPRVVLGYLWGALARLHDFHYRDRGREG